MKNFLDARAAMAYQGSVNGRSMSVFFPQIVGLLHWFDPNV